MTGMTSRIMSVGLFVDFRNASTTLRRLMALARFWPLPLAMVSRSSSATAARSMASSRSRTDSAPMPPVK